MKTFLKVPQKVDHALLLVTVLAERYKAEKPLSLDEVAKKEGISQGYLEEVAHLLRAAGIVAGKRGAHGGYVLAKDPEEVTVANIITAMEGQTWTPECIGETPHRKVPANDGIWRKVQGQVMSTLHNMTIADIVSDVSGPAILRGTNKVWTKK